MFFSWTIIIIVRTYVVSLALFTSFHCLIIVGWDEGVRYSCNSYPFNGLRPFKLSFALNITRMIPNVIIINIIEV